MGQIMGSTPILIGGDGGGGTGGGGTGGGGTYTQPAAAPGPAYPWEGSVGNTKTGNGSKETSINLFSWKQIGGLPVELTLNHNSESNRNGELGPKWICNYDTNLSSDSSGNYTVHWGNGRVYTFTKNVDGSYSPPAGIHEKFSPGVRGVSNSTTIQTKDQTLYWFDSVGHLVQIEDENYNYISITPYGTGVYKITDATHRVIQFGYDTSQRLISITDPLNHQWTLNYDSNGNLAQINWPVYNGTTYNVKLGYDGNHNITSYQDRRGNTSQFFYNADNSIQWQQDNAGNRTTFQYGIGFGGGVNASATSIIDPNGRRTVHTYTTTGQLASIIDPTGYTEYYTYDGDNNVTQKQDRRGYLWKSTYDGMGNVLTATPPGGSPTTITYNGHSKPLTISAPSGRNVLITYDAADNPTRVQEKDAYGNVVATTTYAIGGYGLVSSKTDTNGHYVQYTYDGNGYLATVLTQLGHQTTRTYDALGFCTSRQDAMLRTTTYTPDVWERLVTTTYPDNTTNTYGYDPNGNLTSFSNYTGVWTRGYDADNRLLSENIGGSTRIVGHSYDAPGQRGLLSTTTDADGRVITYAYSARNELASVSEATGTTTYAYDADGNQSHLYLPNGLRTDQYYNPDSTLDSYYDWDGGSNIYQSYGYAYNADHQISSFNEGQSGNVHATANPTQTGYGYDWQGHLTSESRTGSSPNSWGYSYDGAGNRTNANGANPMTYDADDELTNVGGVNAFALTYNANGDRVTESINGQLTTFTYDFDDRLMGITAGGTSTSYSYDALGRQVNRTVNGQLTGYYLNGEQSLVEKGPGGTTQYTWGNGLIRVNGEYPLTDGRGNVRLTTDGSRNVTSSNAPSAYGVASYTANTASPFLWNGGAGYRTENLAPLGLPLNYSFQKVGARYYDPTLGCFLTRDTYLNQKPYTYCNGDPVNRTDPTGHSWLSQFFGSVFSLKNIVAVVVATAVAIVAAPVIASLGITGSFAALLDSSIAGAAGNAAVGQDPLKGAFAGAVAQFAVWGSVGALNQIQTPSNLDELAPFITPLTHIMGDQTVFIGVGSPI